MSRRLSKVIRHIINNKRISHQVTDVWKATHAAKRLLEQYMVRIETTSTFTSK